jgi:hypothetical protein
VLFEEEPSGPKEPYLKLLRRRGVFVIELDPRAPVGEGTQSDPEQWLAMRIDPLQPEHIVTIGREVHAPRRRSSSARGCRSSRWSCRSRRAAIAPSSRASSGTRW